MKRSGASTHIIVGFDFSPLAELALSEAAALAAEQPETAIHIVNVRSNDGRHRISHAPTEDVDFEIDAGLKEMAGGALRAYGAAEGVQVFTHALQGDPAVEIVRMAEDIDADLIIVGTHGRRGIKRLVLGSVAEEVMRGASCPVLVMRPRRRDPHTELMPEPACAECLEVRQATGGSAWWCQEHDKPWVPPHRYSYHSGDLLSYHPDRAG